MLAYALTTLAVCGFALQVAAQDRSAEPAMEEMTTYYVAFLYRGPEWTPERTEETQRLQTAHLGHIQDMAHSGKLLLAGPFMDGGDLRGMFVFKVGSMEEAEALVAEDPAVEAGRLRVEIYPWWSSKGITVLQDPDPD